MSTPTMSESDATLHIHSADHQKAAKHDSKREMEEIRAAIIRHLRTRGWRVHLDPIIRRRYPIIHQSYHRGNKGLLEVKIEVSSWAIRIEFFQNIVRQNRNGGEYDFEKRRRMPYLIGLAYQLERNRLADMLRERFGILLQLEERRRGIHYIMARRLSIRQSHGWSFYRCEQPLYNIQGAHGRPIHTGEIVYFRSRSTGRMLRGIAFHNINSMWWVLLPCGTVLNESVHALAPRWHFQKLHGREFSEDIRRSRISTLEKLAVSNRQYEHAARFRDALDQHPKAA